MVGDEALRLACQLGQFANMSIAASQLAQDPPANRMAGDPEKRGRLGHYTVAHHPMLDQTR